MKHQESTVDRVIASRISGVNKCRFWKITAGVLSLSLLALSFGMWTYIRNQPVTPNQLAEIRSEVHGVARIHGVSKRKVWEQLKKKVGVRKAEQIKRHAMDESLRFLREQKI
ncbi:MAG: hypothetical protein HQL53_09115 [Magnetococcales bacterium]|nr:hypothetical protein [Magnetococcales bacterium]